MSQAPSFWDRRRAALAAEAEAEQAAHEAAHKAEAQAELEAQTDEEILAQLELPEPESLEAGDDFTAFLSDAVPDRIRRRALRVLWRSNPVLANVDQLVDYGEDFTDSATVVENLQTAYQVGKGMLSHVQEMARQAALKDGEGDETPEEETQEVMAEDVPEEPVAVKESATDERPTEVEEEPVDLAEVAAPTPRRMKFTVEEPA
jgi:hypothetical protein